MLFFYLHMQIALNSQTIPCAYVFFQSIKSELKVCYQLLNSVIFKLIVNLHLLLLNLLNRSLCLHVTAFFDTIVYAS